MSLLSAAKSLLALEPMHERSVLFESHAIPLEEQVLELRRKRLRMNRPWRYPSVNEALGVPAIFRAVSLIATSTGSIALEAYRRGVRLEDDAVPSLIKRPDPLRIPRDFYRDTAYYLASRGEYWWYVGKRDGDGNALSLFVVPPWEVTVTPTKDRLRPKIEWLGIERRPEDMRHGTFLPDETGYRGVGPLQMCGAAISVTVEAQEWAARYYVKGATDMWIKYDGPLGGDEDDETDGLSEAQRLKAEWTARTAGDPAVTGDEIADIKQFDINPQGAQMLEAREYQNGDAARMFGISGSLLEYTTPGSNLTYQNIEQEFTKFVRTCLAPGYLEPIEQEMSDLLTRSTVARFNVKGFMRADIKTRFEVYKLAGAVLPPEEAAELLRQSEGMVPGDVEYAPVPLAPPAAFPAPILVRSAPADLRCPQCSKLKAANFAGSGDFKCERCGHTWKVAA